LIAHGEGERIWEDGKHYIGDFEMDKMKGKGSTRWPSGRKHVGNYDDDTAHGKGKEFLLDGTNYFG
jgi:hypothetical protein